MVTRGVASVRSPVNNLWQFNPGLTYSDFENALVDCFVSEYYQGFRPQVTDAFFLMMIYASTNLRTGSPPYRER